MTDEEFSFKTFWTTGILDFEIRFFHVTKSCVRVAFGTLRNHPTGINWFSNKWSFILGEDWFQSRDFTKIFYSINKHNCFNEDFSRYLAEQLMVLDEKIGGK